MLRVATKQKRKAPKRKAARPPTELQLLRQAGRSPSSVFAEISRELDAVSHSVADVSDELTPRKREAALRKLKRNQERLAATLRRFHAQVESYARHGFAWSGRTLEKERAKYAD